MAVQEKRLTIDDFREIAQQPEYQAKRLELIDGKMAEMSPSVLRNTFIASNIHSLLHLYVIKHGLGRVSMADGGFKISDDTVLVPDVAFIATSRIPEDLDQFSPVPPDLAVEVISASEYTPGIRLKTRRYLGAGVQVVWNVFPKDETVDVVSLEDNDTLATVTLRANQIIDGGVVIPGFSAQISGFFKI